MLKKTAIWLNRFLWTVLLSVLILIAVYVSIGRNAVVHINYFQEDIAAKFSEFTGLPISIESLSGQWSQLSPILSMQQLTLYSPVDNAQVLNIENVSFQIDPLESLLNLNLQVRRLRIEGVSGSVEEVALGEWQIKGYQSKNTSATESDFDAVIDLLLSVDAVELASTDVSLFFFENEAPAQLRVDELSLLRSDDFRRVKIQANLDSEEEKPLVAIVESSGDPRDVENFTARAYLKLDEVDFKHQLPAFKFLGIDLQDASIDSEIWVDWHTNRNISIQGNVQTPLVDVEAISGKQFSPVKNVKFEFRSEKDDQNNWQFWVPEFSAQWDGQDVNVEQILVLFSGRALTVSLPSLIVEQRLEQLIHLNVLNDSAVNLLTSLDLQGRFSNFHLNFNQPLADGSSEKPPLFIQLKANMHQLSIAPWKGAPGAKNVSGYVEASARSGMVELDSENFSLIFPEIYEEALDFKTAKGQLKWNVGDERVTVDSGLLTLNGDHGPAYGLLGLDLPVNKVSEQPPLMNLMVGLRNTDAIYRDKFIPKILNAGLRDWLSSSLTAAYVKEGGFIYRGSLLKAGGKDRTTQLFFDVEGGALSYHPEWPSLSDIEGLVNINDQYVSIETTAANVDGLAVGAANIELSPQDGNMLLTVNAQAEGSAADALSIVNSSALRKSVGDVFEHWQMDGLVSVDLNLALGLGGAATEENGGVNLNSVDVMVDIANTDVYIPEYRIEFTDLSGPLNYSAETGIASRGLEGRLYDKPINIAVSQEKPTSVNVAISGSVDVSDVEAWSQQAALSFAKGETNFTANIDVDTDGQSLFSVTSDLSGVEISLPEPYGKTALDTRSFWLDLPIGSELPMLSMGIDQQMELQLRLNNDELISGLLLLDNGQKKVASDWLHDDGHLVVTGEIEVYDFSLCEAVFEQYKLAEQKYSMVEEEPSPEALVADSQSASSDAADLSEDIASIEEQASIEEIEKENKTPILLRNLKIQNFQGFGQQYSNSIINGEQLDSGWSFAVDNSVLAGQIYVSNGFTVGGDIEQADRYPLLIHLDRLHLPAADENEDSVLSELKPIDLNGLALNIMVDDLRSGENDYGSLGFDLRASEQELRVNKIRGDIRGINIAYSDNVQLKWLGDESSDSSHFTGDFSIRDLGSVLEKWQYEGIVESEAGEFGIDLTWPGRPDQWDLAEMIGSTSLKISNGRFLNTNDAAEGTLKVVGIVNLANIVRRLKLDFSDLFDSGVSFDSIDGEINFTGGMLSIADTITIDSPSSEFQLRGLADLRERSLDMELVTTLPVASNLPWIAALAGGFPTAAIVYGASKIFEKQVASISSAVYSVKGDWNNPDLKLSRIFSDGDASKKVLPQKVEPKKVEPKKTENSVDDVIVDTAIVDKQSVDGETTVEKTIEENSVIKESNTGEQAAADQSAEKAALEKISELPNKESAVQEPLLNEPVLNEPASNESVSNDLQPQNELQQEQQLPVQQLVEQQEQSSQDSSINPSLDANSADVNDEQ